MSWMGSHSVGLGADSAPRGLRRRATRWTAGGVAVAATLGGGVMMAAPAAMAAPTIPVPCSTTALRNAIFFSPSDSILVLRSGCVYFIGSALPSVTRDLTIVGSNDTFRATGSGYTMLHNDADLQISHLTLVDGDNTGPGDAGAILNHNDGDLTLSNVTFFDNEGRDGGAILNTTGGDLIISSSTFTDNEATGSGGSGGAIANLPGSTATISSTTFTDNEAVGTGVFGGDGGAIDSLGGSVTLKAPANRFTDNFARDDGGAITSLLGSLSVTGATFTINEAEEDGGAVANFGAVATLNQDGFTRNLAEHDGGGVATGSSTNLGSDTFSLNHADHRGGGLFTGGGTTTLDTTDIFANSASGPFPPGGGIYRASGTVAFGNNVIVRLNVPNNCSHVFCP
jgi:hypothetical protein